MPKVESKTITHTPFVNGKAKKAIAIIALVVGTLAIGVFIGAHGTDYTMTPEQAQAYCRPAEVYMLSGVQEDDLFIPQSSIGRVDLIGAQELTH